MLPFFFFLLPHNIMAGELKFGQALTLDMVTPVSEINNNPKKYVGQRVLIEGLVIDVCAARGCWLDIASDLPFEKIKVKVVDGEIVFPMKAKGRLARVEGIAEEMKLTREQGSYKNAALVSPGIIRIFTEGNTLDVQMATGQVTMERIHRKPILYEANYLHLNKAKRSWIWLADVYGVCPLSAGTDRLADDQGQTEKAWHSSHHRRFSDPLAYLLRTF